MITNDGKRILAKYLIGQAPAYASYIAVGCGAQPITALPVDTSEYSSKTALDFEMFRAPIISRGYVTEGGQSKIVFTAEMPAQERYEITEIGVYSGNANPSASGYDSRTLFSFSRQESWIYNTISGGNVTDAAIPSIDIPLDEQNSLNDMDSTIPAVFQTNATNKFFSNEARQIRNEQCRYLNNMVMIRGDYSSLDAGEDIDTATSQFISLTPISLTLRQNALTDLVKVAFSIVNVAGASPANTPEGVRIVLEFVTPTGASATMAVSIDYDPATYDFDANRYWVESEELGNFEYSSGFSWDQANALRVYSAVLDNGAASDQFYVALDAIRLDNVTSTNPLYGLTAYSPIINDNSRPIVKLPNTTSFIEFRLGVDI
jgi:hypothetical protein